MARIWNKHKQTSFDYAGSTLLTTSQDKNTPLKPHTSSLRGRRKVFVGMSGGVDSSVAAYLLKKQNYNVVGVYLLCFSGPVKEQSSHGASEIEKCKAEQDMEDAKAVAHQLGIPFYVWNLEKEYKGKVIDYMVEGYRVGITPNPDVMCNREIKFGIFLQRALAMGADFVATGHYVRLLRELPIINDQFSNKVDKNFENLEIVNSLKFGNCKLKIARDSAKDQSYFLWTLTQDKLKHCLFPIGDYTKPEVREIARKAGLKTADKKDSQGVCFVGKIKLPEFLSASIARRKGDVVTVSGKKVGEHNGAEFYTIGQRHINVNYQLPITNYQKNNKNNKNRKPFYVAEKDIKANTVTIAGGDDPALYKKEIELTNVNFINSHHSNILQNIGMIKVMARVRYRQPLAAATLYKLPTTNYKLSFDQPVKFVAPGQSAVFYNEDGEMLGGGVIVK